MKFMNIEQKIQYLLNKAVLNGSERGVQVAAYMDGKLIVDAWAGIADSNSGCEVNGETLFPVFSTGKGIASTAIHCLVEQGKLNYGDCIAKYWPEFSCNGKEHVKLWHILSHRAGLFQIAPCRETSEFIDYDLMCERLAKITPEWEPGTKTRYHSLNFSWLIAETARRADGREFADIVQEEVCNPLGIESLFFGIDVESEKRVALLERSNNLAAVSDDRTMMNCWEPLEEFMNLPEVRQACLPAFNCMVNARSLARCYAALIGNVDGVRLLSSDTIQKATILNRAEDDPIPLIPGTWELFGLGYVLYGPKDNLGQIFGHGGYGGSETLVDVDQGLTVAFTKNLVSSDQQLRQQVYETFGIKPRNW